MVRWLLWRTGLNELFRRLLAKNGRFVLVFHGVADKEYPGIARPVHPHHTADQLRQTLAWLAGKWPFLTPAQFFAGTRPGILLTFDDGLANNFEQALPVLEQFSAPAIFFVSTQHVLRPDDWLGFNRQRARQQWGNEAAVPPAVAHQFFDGLSVEQLAACGAHPLLTIGGHTLTHPFLTRCPDAQLWQELTASRHYLQEVSGQPVGTFAYPTNDYDRRVAEATQRAGYKAAFAVESRRVGLPKFEIRRIGLYQSRPEYLSTKLNGLYRRPVVVAN